MRITGWIFTVLGILSLLGCLLKGNNPIGLPFGWGLAYFLFIGQAKKNKKRKKKISGTTMTNHYETNI